MTRGRRFGVRLWAEPSTAFECRTGVGPAQKLHPRSESGDVAAPHRRTPKRRSLRGGILHRDGFFAGTAG
jgi:hypothetical protein